MGLRVTTHLVFNDLPRLVDGMAARAAEEVAKTTFDIEAGAKAKAPVDTGNLMNSITAEVDGLTGTVSTNVEYAPYQEYGTSKMPAHPYMTPAAEAAWPDFLAGMTKVAGG